METTECRHEHWVFLGSNTFRFGQCHDCGKEIPMHILLNNWHELVDERLRKLEALVEKKSQQSDDD